ncbi:LuxR C-terminal-related transcriptional regulator [Kitasatospora sp. Root107]|uniref:LuxR C-terminal-related transcriptional regulator n=1 Tax=Kitasatospora sp. Root107 TaxID=1736424 RepID=UPI0009E9EE0F|nr:LuxR C-terminal-related transcriptional regulator [Kitasatospora sp. Root107]
MVSRPDRRSAGSLGSIVGACGGCSLRHPCEQQPGPAGDSPSNPLSLCEREVLRLAAQGAGAAHIAGCLFLSKETVQNYGPDAHLGTRRLERASNPKRRTAPGPSGSASTRPSTLY